MLTTGTLPATKTRQDWSFTYVASTDPTALADGTLVIIEEQGKVKKRTITSTYGVQEEPARGYRSFLLVKAGHAGNLDTAAGRAAALRCGDVYAVAVGGARPGCTCPGFAAGKRTCKHMIAIRELLAVGDLPTPFLNGDADRSGTEPDGCTPDGYEALRDRLEALPEAECDDAPIRWPLARRVDVTPDRVEAAAEFLRRLA